MDWQIVPDNLSTPVINLIQGIRHAEIGDPRREYLRRRALRICVSTEVQEAIATTGIVNGPIVTIPNGVDLPKFDMNALSSFKSTELLIAGMKNPKFASQLSHKLGEYGYTSSLLLKKIERDDFLNQLRVARIAILLPQEKEGFFLPALEAMAMGCLVICPDCVGNRSFCNDGVNSFRPAYTMDATIQAVLHADNLEASRIDLMKKQALLTVEKHSLANERMSFQKILAKLNKI
jgi:glycosyltransferase involved in cell wall biosynthesis